MAITTLPKPEPLSTSENTLNANNSPDILVFIWDFDQTLSIIHTHGKPEYGCFNPLNNVNYQDKEIRRNIKGNIKHPHLLKAIFSTIKKVQKEYAIASFHDGKKPNDKEPFKEGPNFIREYLSISIPGLDHSTLPIRAYLPPDEFSDKAPLPNALFPVLDAQGKNVNHQVYGKNPFIEFLVKDYNTRCGKVMLDLTKPEDRKRIVLIDDSDHNIKVAKEAGFHTIYVDEVNPYDYMLQILNLLRMNDESLIRIKKEILDENDYLNDSFGDDTERKMLLEQNKIELIYLNRLIELFVAQKIAAENKEVEKDFQQELVSMRMEELEAALSTIKLPFDDYHTARVDSSWDSKAKEELKSTAEQSKAIYKERVHSESSRYFSRGTIIKGGDLSKVSGEPTVSFSIQKPEHDYISRAQATKTESVSEDLDEEFRNYQKVSEKNGIVSYRTTKYLTRYLHNFSAKEAEQIEAAKARLKQKEEGLSRKP